MLVGFANLGLLIYSTINKKVFIGFISVLIAILLAEVIANIQAFPYSHVYLRLYEIVIGGIFIAGAIGRSDR